MKAERRVLAEHTETLLGLPYPIVLHDSAVAKVDAETGDVLSVAIPDLDGLLAAVVMARCLLPVQLAPEEIRFMRTVLGLRSGELAEKLAIAPETYSRWETGKQPLGEYAERVLRLHMAASVADRLPAMGYDPLVITGMRVSRRADNDAWLAMSFRRVRVKHALTKAVDDGWEAERLAA